jgi:hypothetical protein
MLIYNLLAIKIFALVSIIYIKKRKRNRRELSPYLSRESRCLLDHVDFRVAFLCFLGLFRVLLFLRCDLPGEIGKNNDIADRADPSVRDRDIDAPFNKRWIRVRDKETSHSFFLEL